jgi:hypothetical protein
MSTPPLLIAVAHVCSCCQGPRPKRKYTRRKDPAEVSLVEYENEMVTPIEKARRMRGEEAGGGHNLQ